MPQPQSAGVHVNVSMNASNNQVVFHNPGQHPLPTNAGVSPVATAKAVGNPNGNAQGQVNATSPTPGPVFSNPA